jgi:hypothetical protein
MPTATKSLIPQQEAGKQSGSKTVAVINGKFICVDTLPGAPLNANRTVNTDKLTSNIMEAKDFNNFPQEIAPLLQSNPNVKMYEYQFEILWTRHIDTRYQRP